MEGEHIGYFSIIFSVANANPKKLHNQISHTTTYPNPKLVAYVLFESFRVYVIYTDVVWNDSYLALTALPARVNRQKQSEPRQMCNLRREMAFKKWLLRRVECTIFFCWQGLVGNDPMP